MHPMDRFSSNGNGHVPGNGHADQLLDSPGINLPTSPAEPPKPASASSSLKDEAVASPSVERDTPEASERTSHEDTGRDAKGRFTKGNKGGPGNPYNRRIAEFKQRFHEHLSDEIIDQIIGKLIEMALKGDKFGLRMVLEYNFDKKVQPDRVNIEEAEILQREAGIMTQMGGLLTKPEPSLPLTMIREARAAATESVGNMMVNLLNCPQERIPEMQSVLQHDPKTARDWLDNGVPQRRKKETRRERKQKAQQRKRPG